MFGLRILRDVRAGLPTAMYYHPNIYAQYLYGVEKRLNKVLDQELDTISSSEDSQKEKQQQSPNELNDEKNIESKQKSENTKNYYQKFIYSSHSTYDGQNYVEENRQKITNSDGKVQYKTTRRLGDRWYQSESTTNKDGKVSTKEVWHNVSEDKIDQFKSEWAELHQLNLKNPAQPISHKEESNEEKEEQIKQEEEEIEKKEEEEERIQEHADAIKQTKEEVQEPLKTEQA